VTILAKIKIVSFVCLQSNLTWEFSKYTKHMFRFFRDYTKFCKIILSKSKTNLSQFSYRSCTQLIVCHNPKPSPTSTSHRWEPHGFSRHKYNRLSLSCMHMPTPTQFRCWEKEALTLHLYLSALDFFHRISLHIWLLSFCYAHFCDCYCP
jgi:hypothetical protein